MTTGFPAYVIRLALSGGEDTGICWPAAGEQARERPRSGYKHTPELLLVAHDDLEFGPDAVGKTTGRLLKPIIQIQDRFASVRSAFLT